MMPQALYQRNRENEVNEIRKSIDAFLTDSTDQILNFSEFGHEE
jgi:hypothetical protein